MTSLSIDAFLGQFEDEGHLDSSGQFTIDPTRARDKLAHFLLSETRQYLLKLVQAGVALGARSLTLESSIWGAQFEMNGVSLPAQQLRNSLLHLLSPNPDGQHRGLRHLGIAINTIIESRPSGIWMGTWDGSQGEQIQWRHRCCDVQAWKSEGSARIVLKISRNPQDVLAQTWEFLSQRYVIEMFTGALEGLDGDRQLLWKRVKWCPIPVKLNGRLVPEATLHCRNSQLKWTELLPGDPGIRRWTGLRKPAAPSPVTAVSTIPAFGLVEWVFDGVTVGSESAPEAGNGAVLSAHACNTDLSGLSILNDDVLQRRRRTLLGRPL